MHAQDNQACIIFDHVLLHLNTRNLRQCTHFTPMHALYANARNTLRHTSHLHILNQLEREVGGAYHEGVNV